MKMVIAGILLAAVTGPAVGQAPHMSLQALDQLEPGLWQIDVQGQPPRQICLTDPMVLVQLAHNGAPACSRFVIANELHSATVHYSCNAAGWGRTTVRATTARVAQVDTQGISGKAPFQFSADARKVGPCVTAASAAK